MTSSHRFGLANAECTRLHRGEKKQNRELQRDPVKFSAYWIAAHVYEKTTPSQEKGHLKELMASAPGMHIGSGRVFSPTKWNKPTGHWV